MHPLPGTSHGRQSKTSAESDNSTGRSRSEPGGLDEEDGEC